jgi:thiamine pyrophosphate-dependent acetolactate synthase large subunit-like protein
MPLIIPPVKQKSYELFGGLFSAIWTKAEHALTMADQIIVIGYSFPRTDHKSISLFKSAFSRRRTIPKVVIIDPYPQRAAELFRSTLGITGENLEVHAENFTESYDISGFLHR